MSKKNRTIEELMNDIRIWKEELKEASEQRDAIQKLTSSLWAKELSIDKKIKIAREELFEKI